MTTRKAKAMLERLEKAMPALPVPVPTEEPADYEVAMQRLLGDLDGDGLDDPSRRAFADMLPYREAIREFARGLEEREQDGAG